MWYWISIENLFRDTSLIFDILPKLFAINKLYRFTWKHYRKLENIEKTKVFGYFGQDLELPEVLCQKIGFRKQVGERVELNDFIGNINDIKAVLVNNYLLYDQLDFLDKVFNDSNFCIELLERFEQMAREKLFFIYRIRNKIVHNANNQKTATSNYYLSFISKASSDILCEFIRKRNSLSLESRDDILNEILYDFDKLKIEIKEIGSEILLNSD